MADYDSKPALARRVPGANLRGKAVPSSGRVYEVTRAGMRGLERAGVVRRSHDVAVRNAFLLSNGLAVLLFGPHLSQVVGSTRCRVMAWSAGRPRSSMSAAAESLRLRQMRKVAEGWQASSRHPG